MSHQTAPHKEKWWGRACMFVPCHRKSERCFHIKGQPMPICSRCLSILIGSISLPFFFFYPMPLWIGLLLQIPMIIDGITQAKGMRMSTNRLRTLTGLGSGVGLAIGITSIFYMIINFTQ